MDEHTSVAVRVSAASIIGNIFLSVFKLLAGIIASSAAMISDAVHSASDVASSIVVIIGVKIAAKAPDKDHEYGHERLECVAAFVLATILAITGVGIGYSALVDIIHSASGSVETPGVFALVAAAVSIVVKECMYHYTRHAALKIKSDALMADAWHHRTDALSSIGSFAGILGARLGIAVLDPVAAVLIAILVIKAAFDIGKGAMDKMVDKACDPEVEEAMAEAIKGVDGVMGLDVLHTRVFAARAYVDVEISADGGQTLESAHEIAENVHHLIETRFPDVKHCTVHVNPYGKNDSRAREAEGEG